MVLIGTLKRDRSRPLPFPLPFITRSAAILADSMRHGKVSKDCHDLNSKVKPPLMCPLSRPIVGYGSNWGSGSHLKHPACTWIQFITDHDHTRAHREVFGLFIYQLSLTGHISMRDVFFGYHREPLRGNCSTAFDLLSHTSHMYITGIFIQSNEWRESVSYNITSQMYSSFFFLKPPWIIQYRYIYSNTNLARS